MNLANETLISAGSNSSYVQDDYPVEDPWRPAAPIQQEEVKTSSTLNSTELAGWAPVWVKATSAHSVHA